MSMSPALGRFVSPCLVREHPASAAEAFAVRLGVLPAAPVEQGEGLSSGRQRAHRMPVRGCGVDGVC